MKILFVSNHFSLPFQPGAPRPWKIAHYLRSIGHEVTVITNRRHYFDENLNAFVGTNRERRRIMKEQNVSEKYGKGWY